MNWIRAILAGVVAGIAVNIADFIMHGLIMGPTYARYSVFTKEAANPLWFLAVAVAVAIPAALLFARTRRVWGEGLRGGAAFGFWLGLVAFFAPFYNPLVLEGFPYYLSWCWGGMDLISFTILGAVVGMIYRESPAGSDQVQPV